MGQVATPQWPCRTHCSLILKKSDPLIIDILLNYHHASWRVDLSLQSSDLTWLIIDFSHLPLLLTIFYPSFETMPISDTTGLYESTLSNGHNPPESFLCHHAWWATGNNKFWISGPGSQVPAQGPVSRIGLQWPRSGSELQVLVPYSVLLLNFPHFSFPHCSFIEISFTNRTCSQGGLCPEWQSSRCKNNQYLNSAAWGKLLHHNGHAEHIAPWFSKNQILS